MRSCSFGGIGVNGRFELSLLFGNLLPLASISYFYYHINDLPSLLVVSIERILPACSYTEERPYDAMLSGVSFLYYLVVLS
jgi:hypothetical protein